MFSNRRSVLSDAELLQMDTKAVPRKCRCFESEGHIGRMLALDNRSTCGTDLSARPPKSQGPYSANQPHHPLPEPVAIRSPRSRMRESSLTALIHSLYDGHTRPKVPTDGPFLFPTPGCWKKVMTPAAAAGDAEDTALRLERFDHRRLARPLKKRLPDALLFDATDSFALPAVRSSVSGSPSVVFPLSVGRTDFAPVAAQESRQQADMPLEAGAPIASPDSAHRRLTVTQCRSSKPIRSGSSGVRQP